MDHMHKQPIANNITEDQTITRKTNRPKTPGTLSYQIIKIIELTINSYNHEPIYA